MLTRVLKTAATTLSHTFYTVDTETLTDPTGTPTYAITSAAGVSVASGNATVVGSSTGRVTAPLAGQATTGQLTVAWTAIVGGTTVVETDIVEVVGGFFFTPAQGRASDESLASTERYPTVDLLTARTAVEQECEEICDRAFVPRYARVVLDGSGSRDLVLQHPSPGRSLADFRALRSISMAPQLDETFVAFTAAELADVAFLPDGTLRRSGGDAFTEGWQNVVVEYEYGLDAPPQPLVDAALVRFRTRLNLYRSGIPDRAQSFTATDGGTYRLSMPGTWTTGVPDVDAVYSRYSRRMRTGPNGGHVPASRTLTYDVQRHSLFHGRRS